MTNIYFVAHSHALPRVNYVYVEYSIVYFRVPDCLVFLPHHFSNKQFLLDVLIFFFNLNYSGMFR